MKRLVPILLALTVPVPAQDPQVGAPYWVSTPPGARSAQEQAGQAVAHGDWAGAARAIQEVFDRYATHFLQLPREGRYVGARRRAVELLATMPEEVRTAYEAVFGGEAEEALRLALSTDDRARLVDVARRFEGTRAGLRAILALADRALLRGQPAEARLLLARVGRLHPAALDDPGVRKRLALAAARDHAEGGPPPTDAETLAPAPPVFALEAEAWPMLGGDPSRGRVAPRAMFRDVRYAIDEIDVPWRPYDQSRAPSASYGRSGGRYGYEFENYWKTYAPVHPVISNGFLVFHDGRRITAANLYTGEIQWSYPQQTPEPDGRTNLATLFSPVVVGGVVYASLETESRYEPQTLQGIPITYYLPTRRLVALELETGRVVWSHEGQDLSAFDGTGSLERLSITGVPLVRGDRVYAGAVYSEGTFHCFLTAVDRHTGRLVYATRISNGQQELNLFGRQLQESVPTPVAEAGGVLYYGTNLGVVAAVDAVLGTPLWATSYPIEEIPSTFLWYEAPRRWPVLENGPPIVAGDLLLVAPADGDRVLALDRGNGRVRWQIHSGRDPRLDRLDVRYLIGADRERAYVSGSAGVAAVNLSDGSRAWVQPLARGEEPDHAAGRGMLAANGLWIPADRRVYRLDAGTGKVLDSFPRDVEDMEAAVNLVAGDGVLVAAGKGAVVVRWDEEDVIGLARERVERAKQEAAPLLAAADLYLAVDRVEDAVELYRKARARASESGAPAAAERARLGLHRALVRRAEWELDVAPARARETFEAALRAAPAESARWVARRRLEELLVARDLPEDAGWRLDNLVAAERESGIRPLDDGSGRTVRGWALRRIAEIHAAAGRPRQALEVLHALLASDPRGPDGRHAAEEIERVLETAGRAAYAPYEKRAESLFRGALDSGDLEALDRALLLYPNSEAAAAATLDLARRRMERGEHAAAASVLQRFLVEREDEPRAAEALLLLVEALHARGSFGSAYHALLSLKTRHGDATVRRADGAEVPARDLAADWFARDPYRHLARSARRKDLEPPLRLTFAKGQLGTDIVEIPELVGERPPELRDAVVFTVGNRAIVLNGRDGRLIHDRIDFGGRDAIEPLVFSGGRIFAATLDDALLVFDAATGERLHRRAVPGGGRVKALVESRGQVFLLSQNRRDGAANVAAIDPEDGAVLWSRRLTPEGEDQHVLYDRTLVVGDRLLVFAEDPASVTFLGAATGAVDGRVRLHDGSRARISTVESRDGIVLVGLETSERMAFSFTQSYELVRIDPSRDPDRARVWSYRAQLDGRGRSLRVVHMIGDWVVAVDDARHAVVLDLQDGTRRNDRTLSLGSAGDLPLASQQPLHESRLLLLTRPQGSLGAHLACFTVPDLDLAYVQQVGEPFESPHLVPSHGVVALGIQQPDGAGIRVRLYDPISGRALEEHSPPGGPHQWVLSRVQNGFLLMTTDSGAAYGFGPD